MTTERVPAASARRRARAALTVALATCAALWSISVVFTGPDESEWTVGAALTFVIIMIMPMLPCLDQGWRFRLEDERYLTARTISGWRTVDLHRLMRVSRYRMSPDVDMLILVDADDVRLMMDQKKIIDATRKALTDHPNSAVRMSSTAEYLLDLDLPTRPLRFRSFVRALASPLLLLPLWVVLLGLAGATAEVAVVLGG
jgi:hypothetical protein